MDFLRKNDYFRAFFKKKDKKIWSFKKVVVILLRISKIQEYQPYF